MIRHHKTGANCDDLSGKNFCKHLLLEKESWNNKEISVFDASFSSPKFIFIYLFFSHQNLEWNLVWFPSFCLHAFSYSGWFEEAVQSSKKKGGGVGGGAGIARMRSSSYKIWSQHFC